MSLFNISLFNGPGVEDISVTLNLIQDAGSLHLLQSYSPTPLGLDELISKDGIGIIIIACLSVSSQDQNDKNSERSSKFLKNAGIACIGLAIASPLLVPLALPAVGFGSLGVGASTLASAWHASIGSVAAGSLFATCTSAGMGGAGLSALVSGLTLTSGAAGAACLGANEVLKARNSQQPPNQGQGQSEGEGGGNGGGDDGDGEKPASKDPYSKLEKDNSPDDDEKKSNATEQEERVPDAQALVITVPKGEMEKKQAHTEAVGGKLRFRTETEFGSTVAFYVFQAKI